MVADDPSYISVRASAYSMFTHISQCQVSPRSNILQRNAKSGISQTINS